MLRARNSDDAQIRPPSSRIALGTLVGQAFAWTPAFPHALKQQKQLVRAARSLAHDRCVEEILGPVDHIWSHRTNDRPSARAQCVVIVRGNRGYSGVSLPQYRATLYLMSFKISFASTFVSLHYLHLSEAGLSILFAHSRSACGRLTFFCHSRQVSS